MKATHSLNKGLAALARTVAGPGVCLVVLASALAPAPADEVQMANGDRYVGKVLSVSSNSVVLQSEVLGTVTLPREKVAALGFGVTAGASLAASPSIGSTNAAVKALPPLASHTAAAATNGVATRDLSTALKQPNNQNMIDVVRAQYLADAGPEANQKFNELMGGLMSGKMSLEDLRSQAATAASQIRALKKDLGSESSGELDEYLAILEKFVNETKPAAKAVTNSLSRAAQPSARKP